MNDVFNSNEFTVQVIAAGSFADKPGYADGRMYLVETATVRLNHAALYAWSETRTLDDRDCFETEEEWVKHTQKKHSLYLEFKKNLADAVGFTPDPDKEEINIKQVVSEVFTVVWIHEIK